jgi:hypothetical protein
MGWPRRDRGRSGRGFAAGRILCYVGPIFRGNGELLIRLVGVACSLIALLPPASGAAEPGGRPGAAGAAESDGLTLYISGGIALAEDPPELGELWKTAPSVAGGLGIRFSPTWEVVATLAWQRFPTDEAAQIDDLLLAGPGGVLEIASLDGRDATALTVTAELRFLVPTEGRRVLPYLSFGWGYFDISTADATVTAVDPGVGAVTVLGDSDGGLGVTIGGGLHFPLSAGTVGLVETGYTVGFTEPISTQYLPFRLGLGFRI